MAGVSKHAGVYFMWYLTRGTSVPSGVLFCKSSERVLHSSVPFHKYFEHPYLLANQLNSNLYIFWPIKIQMSKVGARVATGGEVLRRRSASGSRDEIANSEYITNRYETCLGKVERSNACDWSIFHQTPEPDQLDTFSGKVTKFPGETFFVPKICFKSNREEAEGQTLTSSNRVKMNGDYAIHTSK